LRAYLRDTGQEEGQPFLPGALVADCLEQLIIAAAVLLQKIGEVEDRLVEDAPLHQQEGDQQTPDAAVAVKERVDGFELGMGEADPDQDGEIALAMEELLQVPKGLGH